jgi:hypothetical protein
MLTGDINYTQLIAEIIYDSAVLKYEGYDDLVGVLAACAPTAADKISMRVVPSTNMISGVSCDPAAKIVTLKFLVKDILVEEALETYLDFGAIAVNSSANYVGSLVAPGVGLPVTLHSPIEGRAGALEVIEEAPLTVEEL